MKLALDPFFLSSVLLLSALLAAGAAAADTDAVLDTDGNALRRGTKYYILQSPGIGGGLRLGSRNRTCTLDVVKSSSETDVGLPVSIFPADKDEDTVRLGRDANFRFTAYTTCIRSLVWRIRAADEPVTGFYVSTGGVLGNPGRETLGNWFSIRKLDDGSNSYGLVYCPTVCDICRPYCGEAGLSVEDGRAWLLLRASTPLSVVFKKA